MPFPRAMLAAGEPFPLPVLADALGGVRGAPEPKAAEDEAAAVASGAASEYARRGTLSLPSTTLSIASSRKLESSVEVTDSLLTRTCPSA